MDETFEWVDADNHVTTLVALRGSGGWLLPPYEMMETNAPDTGMATNVVSLLSRDVDVPILVSATSRTALVSAWRALVYALDPKRGVGKLQFTHVTGNKRELHCRYRQGLPGADAIQALTWFKTVLTFRAIDPYWYATSPVSGTYVLGEPVSMFPFFPLRMSSSSVFSSTTVTNQGDTDAWPVWTLTGPGINPVFKNLTTGKQIVLTITLAAREVLEIDTRPGYKTLRQGSTNKFSCLSKTSSLWSLRKGNNSVQIEMSGSTTSSRIVMSYYPRYLSI